jgi:Ca2+/Na+ antiporter
VQTGSFDKGDQAKRRRPTGRRFAREIVGVIAGGCAGALVGCLFAGTGPAGIFSYYSAADGVESVLIGAVFGAACGALGVVFGLIAGLFFPARVHRETASLAIFASTVLGAVVVLITEYLSGASVADIAIVSMALVSFPLGTLIAVLVASGRRG